jgi:repressor LexA
VRGDSMRDEHIVEGDYVLVESTSSARQGEIIVALVRGSETTLKRYYIEGSTVRLQPSNAEMEPIYVPLSQIAIQGRVLGVLRRYALGRYDPLARRSPGLKSEPGPPTQGCGDRLIRPQ